jgi:hypothetical protein
MSAPGPAAAPSRAQRLVAFLHRHPIFTLALLTPGIPEYVLGSSNLALAVILPPLFVALVLVNVAMYTAGALLVREAMLRWNKGLASLVALGAAYAIVEEGVGTATFFNPHTSAASFLGAYGHFAGVNWVFTLGIVGFHAFISIGLPIALLGRVLPETRGRSLLHGRQVPLVLGLIAADAVLVLLPFSERLTGFVTPLPLLLACGLAIAALVALARWLPRDFLHPSSPGPTATPLRFAVLGAAFEPAVLLVEAIPPALGLPALADFLLLSVVGGAFAYVGLRWLGRSDNDLSIIALGVGVVASLTVVGCLITWPIPVTLISGGLALVGLGSLYRAGSRPGGPGTPASPSALPEKALS